MKWIQVSMVFAALFLPSLAFGQQTERSGQRYVFAAVGGWPAEFGPDTQLGLGFGGEKRVYRSVGVGGEIQAFWGVGHNYGGLVATANGSYHFPHIGASGKWVGFGTGGFSAIAEGGEGSGGGIVGFNLGGGLNYWTSRDRALRVEFRDHVSFDYAATHKFEIRIGLGF